MSEDLAKIPDCSRFSVARLISQVLDASEIADTGEKHLSLTAARLVKILQSERSRIDRIESWNRKEQK